MIVSDRHITSYAFDAAGTYSIYEDLLQQALRYLNLWAQTYAECRYSFFGRSQTDGLLIGVNDRYGQETALCKTMAEAAALLNLLWRRAHSDAEADFDNPRALLAEDLLEPDLSPWNFALPARLRRMSGWAVQKLIDFNISYRYSVDHPDRFRYASSPVVLQVFLEQRGVTPGFGIIHGNLAFVAIDWGPGMWAVIRDGLADFFYQGQFDSVLDGVCDGGHNFRKMLADMQQATDEQLLNGTWKGINDREAIAA